MPESCFHVEEADLRNNGLVVFGAGFHTVMNVLPALLNIGIVPEWIIDNDPNKYGKTINQIILKNENISEEFLYNISMLSFPPIEVKNGNSLGNVDSQYVLLASGSIGSMYNYCKQFPNLNVITPSALQYFCYTVSNLGVSLESIGNKPEILAAYKLLADHKSKQIFKDSLLFYCTGISRYLEHYDPQTYFPSDLIAKIDYSSFVDAGAFTGDTLKEFLRLTQLENFSYYAFEPCTSQFLQLEKYVESLPIKLRNNITLVKKGLGDKEKVFTMQGNGVGAALIDNDLGEKVEVTILDSFSKLLPSSICTPTCLKADVEGFELNMLIGAKETIITHNPTIIFSAYHKNDDLWVLPLWLDALNLGYQFYFRHHYKTYGDTVLYAIPGK